MESRDLIVRTPILFAVKGFRQWTGLVDKNGELIED